MSAVESPGFPQSTVQPWHEPPVSGKTPDNRGQLLGGDDSPYAVGMPGKYGTPMNMDVVHVAPGHGPLMDLGGLGVHFKVRGELTGGRFAVVEHPIQPGILVDPHTHKNEDELSYVVEGAIWARVGDQEIESTAGAYVWKPRGVLHAFWNPGPAPARILEVISPAGFEHLFEEVASLMEHPSATTEEEVYDLCRRYGLTFDRSWLPDLESRFGPMRIV